MMGWYVHYMDSLIASVNSMSKVRDGGETYYFEIVPGTGTNERNNF